VTTASSAPQAVIPAKSIVVPDDFSTIQKAVDNASVGGTVFVRSGIYLEQIVVETPLSLIGEDRENTVISVLHINDSLTSAAIEVKAKDVTISGFTIKNAQVGIKIAAEPYQKPPSSRCEIIDNIITENFGVGIFAESGESHLISRNTITKNGDAGIYCRSSHSTISRNNITENGGAGIIVNSCGILVIKFNTLSGNRDGLGLYWNGWFHVYGNEIVDNQGYGVEFGEGCHNSTVSLNNIKRNGIGVNLLNFGLTGTSSIGLSNQVSLNNILDNSQQVFVDLEWDLAGVFPEWSNGTDVISWNSSARGNYWGDYFTKYPNAAEIGTSKVGDTHYIIDETNIDYFPLTKPVEIPLAPRLGPYDLPIKTVAFVAAISTILVVVFLAYQANRKKKQKIRSLSRRYGN
jgi:parallel beta-helix repeat protein